MKQQLNHLLIGVPGCGKSTLAQAWTTRSPEHIWISTDQIRAELFGDANQQGDWEQVRTVVMQQVIEAMQSGYSVIYDATNVRRSWRLEFLQQVAAHAGATSWIAWQFVTSLEACKIQNKTRQRQVPEPIIDQYYEWLQTEQPSISEGFTAVYTAPSHAGRFDFESIEAAVARLL